MTNGFVIERADLFVGVALLTCIVGCGSSGNQVDAGKSGAPTKKSVAAPDDERDARMGGDESGRLSSESAAPTHPQEDTLEESVRQLGRLGASADTERAITALVLQGDAAVEAIENVSTDLSLDFGWVHTSVRVLERINTVKSRTTLRKIALGDIKVDNPNLQRWAAQALVSCDPKEAASLLSSSNARVLEVAILRLRGHGMDQELLNALSKHTRSEDPDTRWRAASVIASEVPPGELARQALDDVKESLMAVSTIPNLAATDPSSGHVNFTMTVGEVQYQRYLSILEAIRVEHSALHTMAAQLQGPARDTVLLALAFRKDTSVHDEIVRIAHDPDAGMFRAWAASAFESIGEADDLLILRRLAATDRLERQGGGLRVAATNYPVRESAKQAIGVIERRVPPAQAQ